MSAGKSIDFPTVETGASQKPLVPDLDQDRHHVTITPVVVTQFVLPFRRIITRVYSVSRGSLRVLGTCWCSYLILEALFPR